MPGATEHAGRLQGTNEVHIRSLLHTECRMLGGNGTVVLSYSLGQTP